MPIAQLLIRLQRPGSASIRRVRPRSPRSATAMISTKRERRGATRGAFFVTRRQQAHILYSIFATLGMGDWVGLWGDPQGAVQRAPTSGRVSGLKLRLYDSLPPGLTHHRVCADGSKRPASAAAVRDFGRGCRSVHSTKSSPSCSNLFPWVRTSARGERPFPLGRRAFSRTSGHARSNQISVVAVAVAVAKRRRRKPLAK